MIKLLVKLILALVVALAIAPFVIKDPQGKPYMTLDKLKQLIQDPSSLSFADESHAPSIEQLKTLYQLQEKTQTTLETLRQTLPNDATSTSTKIDYEQLAQQSKRMTPQKPTTSAEKTTPAH